MAALTDAVAARHCWLARRSGAPSRLPNLFLRSTGLDWLISIVGIGVFAGLTAYDTQRIKAMYDSADDEITAGRKSTIGALSLYLNLINLFMMLLRLLGGRR